MTSFPVTLTQEMALGDVFNVGQPVLVTDGSGFAATTFPARALTMTQGIGTQPALSRQYKGGGLISQGLGIRPALSPLSRYHQAVVEALTTQAGLSVARALAMVEGLGIQELQTVYRAVQVIQGLGLHDAPSPRGTYHFALTQGLGLHPALARFLGGDLVENFSFHPDVARQYLGHAALAQAIGVQDVSAGQLIFRLDVAEGFHLHEVDALKTIYHGDISETVNLWVAYVDPGGGFTTWAINTRTNAVTEYQNYVFNSITRMGHKFIGATSTGLWELDGELDGTDAIPTRIKSGWMQVTGSKFTSFKAAYLGLKAQDDATDFILKLHAGDGREYVYAVRPNNMATTKVSMGKGLRSRYFAFELVTLGADYDLDSVEFVPISSGRRV
jgi:hypothetical protein